MPPKRKTKTKAKAKQTHRQINASASNPARGRVFPSEIIFSILSRLPVKSLLRFKCVSKQWRKLISLPKFTSAHLTRSAASTIIHAYRSPIPVDDQSPEKFHQLELDPAGHVIHAYGAPIPHPKRHSTVRRILDFPGSDAVGFFDHLEVVGGPNGVVCVVQQPFSQRFTLWNPATRSARPLPAPILRPDPNIHRGASAGIGFDPARNEYKVIHIMCHKVHLLIPDLAEVFSLRTGIWKRVDANPGDAFNCLVLRETCEAVVKGTPYWRSAAYDADLGTTRGMLVSFDVNKDVFNQEAFAWVTKGKGMCIGEIKDCLGAVVWEKGSENAGLDVWVKGNESGTWSKIYRVERLPAVDLVVGRVVGFYGGRGIVLEIGYEGNLMMFNLENMEVEDLINVEDSLPISIKVVSYREGFTRIPEIGNRII